MSEPRRLRSVSSHDTPAARQPTDIPERAGEPASYDTGIAHPGRVYDYLLGGKENYGADRAAARELRLPSPLVIKHQRRAGRGRRVRPSGRGPGRGGRRP